MIKIKEFEVYGLDRTIIASGLPMTSGEPSVMRDVFPSDLSRAIALGTNAKSSGHANFLKGIVVKGLMCFPFDIEPQFLRYNFFVIDSCQSTMHRPTAHIELDSFDPYVTEESKALVQKYLNAYLEYRTYHNFMVLRRNMPLGVLLWWQFTTNYMQLANMYAQRRNHKLREDWGAFCDWCEGLPLFKELTQKKSDKG